MKKAMNITETEYYTFGSDNKLRVFPPNTFNFKPKGHIITDEVQQCLLDNLWFQYTNKREDKGYFLAILNSLSEYFNQINQIIPSECPRNIQIKPLYVLFNGKNPGIYTSYEQIVMLKYEMERKKGTPSFHKYMDVNEAIDKARMTIGPNFYVEPSAKEYIQKYRLAQSKNNKNIEEPKITKVKESVGTKIKEEASPSNNPTYAEIVKNGIDPLDGEYIDWKIDEKFEIIAPAWKEDIKKEVLEEIKKEINEKIEELKTICDEKYISSFLEEDCMDIGGHGQKLESENNTPNE